MSAFESIDVHSMTRVQAITAIDAKLRRCKGDVYSLKVIHGFHGGTVLRDAVARARSSASSWASTRARQS